jgi:hypothetical protein
MLFDGKDPLDLDVVATCHSLDLQFISCLWERFCLEQSNRERRAFIALPCLAQPLTGFSEKKIGLLCPHTEVHERASLP